MYNIFVGSADTMNKIANRPQGAVALNRKTMKWQTIDKDAKYEVRIDKVIQDDEGNNIECATLLSDLDLHSIAKEKELIM